jgi:N-acetylneuraminate synthase/N,N'-diacetyllegionaminate synthase
MMDMFKRAEISYDEFKRFFAHARSRGLIPLSTPTDNEAVDALDEMGVGAFKVGSDDIVHIPFLKYIGKKGKPVIISAGMANAADIKRGIAAINETGNNDVIVLHCVSQYPTPNEKLNLSKITSIKKQCPVVVGFSDHSQ